MQGRGAGGEDSDAGVLVGTDLEQAGRIFGAMHLVEDDPAVRREASVEQLRVREPLTQRGQVAIEDLRLGNLAAQDGLAEPPRAREPDDAPRPPERLDAIDPERARGDHERYFTKCADDVNYV